MLLSLEGKWLDAMNIIGSLTRHDNCRSEVNASTSISGVSIEDDIATIATLLPPTKEKSKFLPFFRNIPSKVRENITRYIDSLLVSVELLGRLSYCLFLV